MSNKKLIKKIFSESLKISISQVIDDLEYNTIPEWDSLGHMSIIANIEGNFDIMMDTDDIIDMSSFGKAKEILNKKYNVQF